MLPNIVSIDGALNVRQRLQLGYNSANNFIEPNNKLYILNDASSSGEGIKIKQGSSTGAGIKIATYNNAKAFVISKNTTFTGDGSDNFTIEGDGKTTIRTTNNNALSIEDASNNIVWQVNNNGKTIINSTNTDALIINDNAASNIIMKSDGRFRIKGTDPIIETNLNPLGYIKLDNTSNSNSHKAGLIIDTKNINYSGSGGYNNYGLLVNTDNNSPSIAVYNSNFSLPNKHSFIVQGDGKTIIGGVYGTSSNYMLLVNGKIGAREIKVSIQNPWPDYVFSKNYNLKNLEGVEEYITKNKHLPNIPSADELKKDELGLDLAQMQGLQMEKIEEIYLHLIELNKQIKALKKENNKLKQKLAE